MALIKGPLNSIQASGTVGEVTYKRNQYGQYATSYVDTTQIASTEQEKWRIQMAGLNGFWKNPALMSQTDLQAWYDFSRTFPRTNKLGEKIFWSARDWFLHCNLLRGYAGYGPFTTPPPHGACVYNPDIYFFPSDDGIYCFSYPPTIPENVLYVSKVPFQNTTRFFCPNKTQFGNLMTNYTIPALKIWDVLDMDASLKRYFFRSMTCDFRGLQGPHVYQYLDVTDTNESAFLESLTSKHINQQFPTNKQVDIDRILISVPNPNERKALMEFDLTGISQVTKAFLGVNRRSTPGFEFDGFANFHRTIQSWSFTEADWLQSSDGNDWSTPGGQPGVDYVAAPFQTYRVTYTSDTDMWFFIDVTEEIQFQLQSPGIWQFWITGDDNLFWIFESGRSTSTNPPYLILMR